MAVTIKEDTYKGIPIIEIHGELAGYDANNFKEKLASYTKHESKKIAIDLTFVDYLDSSWLGTFIYCMGLFDDNNKKLVFIINEGFIMGLFETSNLSTIANIVETRENLLSK